MMNPAEFENIARCEREFWWFRGMEEILFRVLDPIVGPRKLAAAMEAGCGTGHMASRMEGQYGWRVFPTDLQREGLVYGLQAGVERMAQADVAALPFSDNSFDVAISLDVIVHFPLGQENRAIRELTRVLAPGGILVLRASALDILRSKHSEFTTERQRFTRERLTKLVAAHGVRVLRCTYANSLLLPVALLKFRIIEPLLRRKPTSGVHPLAKWLDRLLFGALNLEARWLGAGRDLPIGQSLILIGERVA